MYIRPMNQNLVYDKIVKSQAPVVKNILTFLDTNPPKTYRNIRSLIKYHKNIIDSDPILKNKTKGLVELQIKRYISTGTRRFSIGSSNIVKIVKDFNEYLNDGAKQRLINCATSPMKAYYSYAKKNIVGIVVGWVNMEQATTIIKTHNRVLDKQIFNILFDKIPEDKRDQKLLSILKKPKRILEKMVAQDLDDAEKRKKIIARVAQNTSLIKKIPYPIHITIEDLKNLSPKRRLNFLNAIFGKIFYENRYCNGNFSNIYFQQYFKNRLITVALLNDSDINDLLFSTALTNNDMVKDWINKYKDFRDVLQNGIKKAEEEIKLFKQWVS